MHITRHFRATRAPTTALIPKYLYEKLFYSIVGKNLKPSSSQGILILKINVIFFLMGMKAHRSRHPLKHGKNLPLPLEIFEPIII